MKNLDSLRDLYSVTGNITDHNTLLVNRGELRALLSERDALMADAEKSYQQGIDDALSMRCVYLMEDFEKEVDALLAARSKGKEGS